MAGRDPDGLDELVDELAGGDAHDQATADVLRALVELTSGGGRTFQELEAVVLEARATLDAAGDEMGVVRAERVLAQITWAMCRVGESHRYCLSVHERLRKLGSTAYQSEIVPAIQASAVFAGRPMPEIRRLLDDLYGEAQEAGPLLTASIEAARARSDYTAGLISAAEVTVVAGALRRAPASDGIADRGDHDAELPLHRLLVGGRRRRGGGSAASSRGGSTRR